MSRTATKEWRHIARQVRITGRENNTQCHLCNGARGPIDYRTQAEADKEARDTGAYWLIGAPRPLAFACDHITPHAAGGQDHINNAAPTHKVCNEQAGAKGAPTRRRSQAVNGHWISIDGTQPPLPGHGIDGTRTATHIFRAAR